MVNSKKWKLLIVFECSKLIDKGFFLLFLRQIIIVKKLYLIFLFLLSNISVFAQNEIGPEGGKLIWILLFFIAVIISLFILWGKKKKTKRKAGSFLLFQKKLKVTLEKDALYYPDNLDLKVTNTRNYDIDMGQPMLVFDNFWLKRKFRIKGFQNRNFYPLYLEKGKSHVLKIDLNRFYSHDKSLKKFPKAKVVVFDVKGKRLGSSSLFLRKTLFKF